MMFNTTQYKFTKVSQWVTLTFGLLCALCVGSLQWKQFNRLEQKFKAERSSSEYRIEATQLKLQLDVLNQFPKLSYDNLLANLSYLNFIQYFGDSKARKYTGYHLNPDFFRIIVNRDPLFLDIYPYLSASVTLYSGQPQKSVDLIQQALSQIPPKLQTDAYFLWQAKGTDELLFLGKNKDAQQSYEMAAKWASRSQDPTMQAIAARSLQTAKFLSANPDSRRARVASWFNLLTNAPDQLTRQIAKKQIEALGGKIISAENGFYQVRLPKKD
jgi:hypothetical protein